MRSIALSLIISFVTLGSGGVSAQQSEAAAWRQVAEAIPLGSKVRVQTLENKRISGTLMLVDATALMVKRNTRRPEPAVAIHFADVGKIERDSGGVNIGKAIAIGVATGAGVILSLFLIALQLD